MDLYSFIVSSIKIREKSNIDYIDRRWILNDYYKSIERPEGKFKSHKRQCESIFFMLSRVGYLRNQGFGIFRFMKTISEGMSSYELRKQYENLRK